MNSSSQQLLQCLEILTDRNKEIDKSSDIAYKIGKEFENVDSSLYYDWMKVKDFYLSIEDKVEEDLNNIYNSILNFSKESIELEKQVDLAVEHANDSASTLLRDIGL